MKTTLKSRLIAIAIALAITLPFSCQKTEDPGPNFNADQGITLKTTSDWTVSLIAGQTNIIGEVTVNYLSPSNIEISYNITEPSWCLMETHLDVQLDPANFPQTKTGNPKVGQFAYGEGLSCAPAWDVTIDLSTIDDWLMGMPIYVAAQAEVSNGEGAWGEGESFPGNNWAMYFECIPPCGLPFIDARDGQQYITVKIGDQCWMGQNLNIGTQIAGNNYQTDNDVIEKFCYGNNASNCEIYGGLYEWNEMMQYVTQEGTQGICPTGWHLPAVAEWIIMTDYVRSQPEYCCNSSTFQIAKALASTTLWNGPSSYPCGIGNDPSTNNGTGFTGLPGGCRTFTSTTPPQPRFYFLTTLGYWWTSTASGDYKALGRSLYWDRAGIGTSNVVKEAGYSVRCVRDE